MEIDHSLDEDKEFVDNDDDDVDWGGDANDDDNWDEDPNNDDDNWGDDPNDPDDWDPTEEEQKHPEPMVPMRRQVSAVTEMSPEDIDKAVQHKVDVLADELSLEKRKCLLLLRKYKWNANKIIDVYFTDPEKILVGAGVCIEPKKQCHHRTKQE